MKTPTIKEFVATTPPEHDLDGMCAWRHFGGCTVEEALERFRSNPEVYQEDFMFMGDPAFVFYFPVIDTFIRTDEVGRGFDGQTWILAHCIDQHISDEASTLMPIRNKVLDLCNFVLNAIPNIVSHEDRSWDPREIQEAWTELQRKL